jgi:hypothetical protein
MRPRSEVRSATYTRTGDVDGEIRRVEELAAPFAAAAPEARDHTSLAIELVNAMVRECAPPMGPDREEAMKGANPPSGLRCRLSKCGTRSRTAYRQEVGMHYCGRDVARKSTHAYVEDAPASEVRGGADDADQDWQE